MRIAINLLLVGLIGLLAYLLIINIQEPIAFKAEKEKREDAVVARLKQIRTAQEHYRAITGHFANDFDTLKHVLSTGQFRVIKVLGNPDDPNFDVSQITYDTTYLPALDSMQTLGISLDSLKLVPYAPESQFDISADTIEYQKTLVDVVEVGVLRRAFMGPYGDPRFAKYDNNYDPDSKVKFGDLNKPNTSGNWER